MEGFESGLHLSIQAYRFANTLSLMIPFTAILQSYDLGAAALSPIENLLITEYQFFVIEGQIRAVSKIDRYFELKGCTRVLGYQQCRYAFETRSHISFMLPKGYFRNARLFYTQT